MASEGEQGFDADRAELFEAIGHPNRIKIIQTLEKGGMGFAELKREVGMESSGHLAFHLRKLEQLVVMNSEGQYVLTGEGREAVRMIQTVRERPSGKLGWGHSWSRKSVFAVLIVALLALAVLAAVQQLEIANLSAKPPGVVTLNGRSFWYSVIPLTELPTDRNFSVLFDGVNFTLIRPHSAQGVLLTGLANATFSVKIGTPGRTFQNGTLVYVLTGTVVIYPDVQTKFPDGVTEIMHVNNITLQGNTVLRGFAQPAFPWFSVHHNPQVAISENSTAVILYVSTGR